jgi:hypothetical protein
VSINWDQELLPYKLAEQDQWQKWAKEIPCFSWPPEWKVKAVPPFGGAIIRYWIKTPKCDHVSVYLDCYDRLGYVGAPYWEVYPYDGDCFRCAMAETEELLKAISECGGQP